MRFSGTLDFGAGRSDGAGLGVGRTSIGRAGAAFVCPAFPGRGPGDATPLGAGLAAVPAVLVTACALVGLGLGTPERGAGGADARNAGAGDWLGAALARNATAVAVGAALGCAGAGDAAFALGAALGTGGLGDGCKLGAAVGAGEDTAVASGFTDTATGAVVGRLTGAAGSSLLG